MYDPAFEKYSLGKVDDIFCHSLASRLTVSADECTEGDIPGEGDS